MRGVRKMRVVWRGIRYGIYGICWGELFRRYLTRGIRKVMCLGVTDL